MKSLQYTIRSIPPQLDVALRKQARQNGQSLNEVLVRALERGVGLQVDAKFDDLNWFIGSKFLDESFDEATAWLDSVPNRLA